MLHICNEPVSRRPCKVDGGSWASSTPEEAAAACPRPPMHAAAVAHSIHLECAARWADVNEWPSRTAAGGFLTEGPLLLWCCASSQWGLAACDLYPPSMPPVQLQAHPSCAAVKLDSAHRSSPISSSSCRERCVLRRWRASPPTGCPSRSPAESMKAVRKSPLPHSRNSFSVCSTCAAAWLCAQVHETTWRRADHRARAATALLGTCSMDAAAKKCVQGMGVLQHCASCSSSRRSRHLQQVQVLLEQGQHGARRLGCHSKYGALELLLPVISCIPARSQRQAGSLAAQWRASLLT